MGNLLFLLTDNAIFSKSNYMGWIECLPARPRRPPDSEHHDDDNRQHADRAGEQQVVGHAGDDLGRRGGSRRLAALRPGGLVLLVVEELLALPEHALGRGDGLGERRLGVELGGHGRLLRVVDEEVDLLAVGVAREADGLDEVVVRRDGHRVALVVEVRQREPGFRDLAVVEGGHPADGVDFAAQLARDVGYELLDAVGGCDLQAVDAAARRLELEREG